jgi:hypothetical protein
MKVKDLAINSNISPTLLSIWGLIRPVNLKMIDDDEFGNADNSDHAQCHKGDDAATSNLNVNIDNDDIY